MNKSILLKAEDWEGLYINGELVEEGHTLNQGMNRIEYFFNLAEEYDFNLREMKELYLTEEDEESVMDWGNFPKDINDLKGVY